MDFKTEITEVGELIVVNTFTKYKHKCLVIPYEEFRELMDILYDTDLDSDETTEFVTWKFHRHYFQFITISPRVREAWQIQEKTFDDISEFFNVGNIVEIVSCRDVENPDDAVYIIYD